MLFQNNCNNILTNTTIHRLATNPFYSLKIFTELRKQQLINTYSGWGKCFPYSVSQGQSGKIVDHGKWIQRRLDGCERQRSDQMEWLSFLGLCFPSCAFSSLCLVQARQNLLAALLGLPSCTPPTVPEVCLWVYIYPCITINACSPYIIGKEK